MSIVTDSTGRIREITQELENTRNELSMALAKPECSGGAPDSERTRITDLHRRINGALSALHGEARDW
ncbi:hypothetical protein [Aliiruegeria sabulilitoris]|uniref:hypothetical protein n=1 Tax=Aliiruegeria sabulilitoris TaxID=1510458 RepID=UPI00082CF227|nr:hypothetical protein [Aliiruegeria sabulilitoris]NDR56109.1 hypothetical protein [Pseudoruegeria sp. M32A2M]